jgi:endonuclease/exonuclease/phosphatase family metal-dependent hydrolase
MRLRKRLNDAQMMLDDHRPRGTLFSRFPVARIDHIFVDRTIAIDHIQVPGTTLARTASDHLPLIVDIRFP